MSPISRWGSGIRCLAAAAVIAAAATVVAAAAVAAEQEQQDDGDDDPAAAAAAEAGILITHSVTSYEISDSVRESHSIVCEQRQSVRAAKPFFIPACCGRYDS